MLLCNAIVGNYSEVDCNDIIKKLCNGKNRIYGHAETNCLNIIFRVFPYTNDDVNCSNKGLILKYFTSNNFSRNEKIVNIKKHYLIPIFNERNEMCYWISNKCLRLRQDELHFSISSYVKEYWKNPVLYDEYSISNNNVIYSGDFNDNYYINYIRKIKIEKEDNTQTLCINLQYKNEEFIEIEYLNENGRMNVEKINVIDLNNKCDHDSLSNDELLKNNNENVEVLQTNDMNIEDQKNVDIDCNENKSKSDEPYNYDREHEIEIIIKSENEPEFEYDNYAENRVVTESKTEKVNNDKVESDHYNVDYITSENINGLKDINNNDNIIINSNEMDVNENQNINYIKNVDLELNKGDLNKCNLDLNLFSVCNEVNINIQDLKNNIDKKLGKNIQGKVELFTENSNSNKESVTLEVIDDIITPVIRQIKSRSKYDKEHDFGATTRSEFYKVENSFYSKDINNISFIPSNIKTNISNFNSRYDGINKELMILNRIETTRKNVNLNNKMNLYKNNNQFSVYNNHYTNLNINDSHNNNNINNAVNCVNIDLLSNRFNRIIGKTDFLLEQLNNCDSNNNNKHLNYGKLREMKYIKERNANKLFSNQRPFSPYSNHNSIDSPGVLNKLEYNKVNQFINQDSINNTDNNKTCLELSKESCLSIINVNCNDDNYSSGNENNADVETEIKNIQVLEIQMNDKGDKNLDSAAAILSDENNKYDDHDHIDHKDIRHKNFNASSAVETKKRDYINENKGLNGSLFDPELTEIDFYLNENKSINSFSIMNIILSKWSGIPTISRL
ncbi:hypothetical protein FG386_002662 [Cryptosporidium ryanae]|uniref:uncharacterized protein n=1 Tax=Cryptosporidium ryanae TaxID=515981 RepID=UPI00351A98BE|nr:hypothetical protein FG386_002662 [Cryptosporidium ryanae]